MTTEPWGETIGQGDVPGPYADCWHRACPACNAPPETRCSFTTEHTGQKITRPRHAPCIARQKTPPEPGGTL